MRSSPLLLLCGAAAAALPRGLPRGSGGHVDLHNVGHTRLHAATAHKTDDALLVGGGRGQWDKHNTQWSVRQVAEVCECEPDVAQVMLGRSNGDVAEAVRTYFAAPGEEAILDQQASFAKVALEDEALDIQRLEAQETARLELEAEIERHLQSLEEVVEGVGKDRRWRMGTPRGATGGAESADAEVVAEAPGI